MKTFDFGWGPITPLASDWIEDVRRVRFDGSSATIALPPLQMHEEWIFDHMGVAVVMAPDPEVAFVNNSLLCVFVSGKALVRLPLVAWPADGTKQPLVFPIHAGSGEKLAVELTTVLPCAHTTEVIVHLYGLHKRVR